LLFNLLLAKSPDLLQYADTDLGELRDLRRAYKTKFVSGL
jgi:hypothetical protein